MFNPKDISDASDTTSAAIEAANAAEVQATDDRRAAIDAINTSNASLADFLAKRKAALDALQADSDAAAGVIASHQADVLPLAIPVPAA